MSNQHLTHRARPLILGLSLAGLFLAGQLSSFTHLLLVRHATCPEHGELVHLEQPTTRLAPRAVDDAEPYVALAAEVADHDHDHCLVCSARREARPAQAVGAALKVAARWLEARPFKHGPSSRCGAEVLRLAPKSSPPA